MTDDLSHLNDFPTVEEMHGPSLRRDAILRKACKQAGALGSAYLLMKPDGSLELLDPGSILLKPKVQKDADLQLAIGAALDAIGASVIPKVIRYGPESDFKYRIRIMVATR